MYRIFLNFAKSCVLSCLSNVDNINMFLGGHTVAMVTYCATKMIGTCSPMIEQFFDTMIVASSDKEWL